MSFGIEIYGPYKDISGIALVVRELSLALYDIGVPTRLTPLDNWSSISNVFSNMQLTKLQEMERTTLPDDHIYINHMPPSRIVERKQGVPNICATIYETDRCPYVWQLIEKQVPLDEIWVPTEWGKQAFVKGGLPEKKIQVIPLGVNLQRYNPNISPAKIIGRKEFVFLSIMDYKTSKGPDLLLNAYFQEFSARDNVTLVLKAYSGGDFERSKRMIKDVIIKYRTANKSTAHLLFLGDSMTNDEIASLHRASNCYVLPTRGEGWSYGTMQSMACGVPTIMTDASGHRSYMNETNGLLVKCRQIPVSDVPWLLREPVQSGHEWWNADIGDLRRQMRWAYEHPKEMEKLGEKAAIDMQPYEWHNIASKVATRTVDILEDWK
jgi:hypothetical protein